jgi:hypothetical protein
MWLPQLPDVSRVWKDPRAEPEAEAAECERYSNIEERALAALAATAPTTRAGAIALLSYLAEVEREGNREVEDDDGERRYFFYDAIDNIAQALEYENDPDDDPDPGDEYDNDNDDELADAVAA